MRFDVLTLFPDMFPAYLGQSLLKRALERGLVDVRLHNIRDWTKDKHRSVDDKPYGGGPGMVMKVEPVVECVEAVQRDASEAGHLVMLTPQGRRLDQRIVGELAGKDRLLLLCGRYEGFDERIRLLLRPDEVSLGDFVLNGGEVAAMAIIDACIRLVPGVVGDEQSVIHDSFSAGGGEASIEFAQYTRPRQYRGLDVPDVLLGGNHDEVARWRAEDSRRKTAARQTASQATLGSEATDAGTDENRGPDRRSASETQTTHIPRPSSPTSADQGFTISPEIVRGQRRRSKFEREDHEPG